LVVLSIVFFLYLSDCISSRHINAHVHHHHGQHSQRLIQSIRFFFTNSIIRFFALFCNRIDPNEVMKLNDLFRTCNMYENIEPLSDEIKVFQCEDADETSSINSALSAMSLRSIANSRRNENISVNEDIFQKVKRVQQMAALRKESKETQQESIVKTTNEDDEDEYDEEKGSFRL